MFITLQKDGSVTWTGSFNQKRLDEFLAVNPKAKAPEPEEPQAPALAAAAYDPGAYTVPDVVAYLEEAEEDEQLRVLKAETAGRARVGITGWAPAPPAEED